jgi:hypothetical protein
MSTSPTSPRKPYIPPGAQALIFANPGALQPKIFRTAEVQNNYEISSNVETIGVGPNAKKLVGARAMPGIGAVNSNVLQERVSNFTSIKY